jgi:hypothetical protein
MSTAFEERLSESESRFDGAEPKKGLTPARMGRVPNGSSGSQLLTDLLGAVPVDLARISEHIRSHAEISELLIRLAGSLLLSGESKITIEEAAVMLGTDRLHVLACMWSIIEQHGEEDRAEKRPNLTAEARDDRPISCIQGINWTAQTLYLATFLRCLGLDSPDSELPRDRMQPAERTWQAEDFADLRNVLMRDFLALLPSLNLLASNADPANAATSGTKPPAKHKTA